MILIGQSRYAVFAGLVTTVTGCALFAAPERFGPKMGLSEPAMTRVIGAADLVLVPGLILGRRQRPWLAARALLNLAIVAHLFRLAGNSPNAALARTVAAGLVGATVGDLRVVVTLPSRAPRITNQQVNT